MSERKEFMQETQHTQQTKQVFMQLGSFGHLQTTWVRVRRRVTSVLWVHVYLLSNCLILTHFDAPEEIYVWKHSWSMKKNNLLLQRKCSVFHHVSRTKNNEKQEQPNVIILWNLSIFFQLDILKMMLRSKYSIWGNGNKYINSEYDITFLKYLSRRTKMHVETSLLCQKITGE